LVLPAVAPALLLLLPAQRERVAVDLRAHVPAVDPGSKADTVIPSADSWISAGGIQPGIQPGIGAARSSAAAAKGFSNIRQLFACSWSMCRDRSGASRGGRRWLSVGA
jgi:hypothetical protein